MIYVCVGIDVPLSAGQCAFAKIFVRKVAIKQSSSASVSLLSNPKTETQARDKLRPCS